MVMMEKLGLVSRTIEKVTYSSGFKPQPLIAKDSSLPPMFERG
jgi:hypothetical protein